MRLGLGLALTSARRAGGGALSIASLFANDEPGLWFDYSDTSTLFQDAAGTTPVTAAGQPVGLVLDKSKGLVLGPELITNGTFSTGTSGWEVTGSATFIASSGVATFTRTAFGECARQSFSCVVGRSYKVVFSVLAGGTAQARVTFNSSGANNADPPFASIATVGAFEATFVATATTMYLALGASSNGTVIYDNISVRELPGNHAMQPTAASRPTYGIVPKTGLRNILLATDALATQSATVTAVEHTLSFRGTGTVTLSGASTAGPLVGTGASDIVSLTFTPTAGSLTLTVSGTVDLAQLEKGAARTGYQRVTTQYDVTETGVQSLGYLSFDGVDDFLVTPTITPNIDKVQVFAGVGKLSDAATGVLVESSVNYGNNSGSFIALAPDTALSGYRFGSSGSITLSNANTTGFVAPITNVITGLGNIAGDTATLRVNGTQVAQSTADQGTGNYLAYPLYIGRRAGTSLPFNGDLYGLVVRFGANLDVGTIEAVEALIQAKTPENP